MLHSKKKVYISFYLAWNRYAHRTERQQQQHHTQKMVKGNFLTNTVLYKTAILNGNKVILFPNLLDFYMKFIVMFSDCHYITILIYIYT